MKRFIYTLILFIIPLVLLFGALEYGLRNIPNDYSFKNHWQEQNISSVKILVIGSSLGYYGIRPQYMNQPTFNASHVSQTIKYDAFIFNKFIDRADSLRLIVWPISYFNLPYELEEDKGAWWRVKSYTIYYDCPYHRYNIKYNNEVVAGQKVFQEISRIFKYLFSDYTEQYCDSMGFGLNFSKNDRIANWYSTEMAMIDVVSHTKDLTEHRDGINANKRRMNEVIQACADRGIQVLLLTPPAYKTYYENLEPQQLNLMTDFCDSLAATYDNTIYLNMLRDPRFEAEDFYDTFHMETDGATKLTKILNEYISQQYTDL